MFCRGISGEGPYLDHVLGYWKAHQENPDKILFLKYENVSADPLPYVKRLAEFMGYRFTAEEEKNGVVEKIVNCRRWITSLHKAHHITGPSPTRSIELSRLSG